MKVLEEAKKRMLKRKLAGEKGSVTLFVLIAMLFFLTIGVVIFITNMNNSSSQQRDVKKIQSQYNNVGDLDEVYEEQKDKQVGKLVISVIDKYKEIYQSTNQNIDAIWIKDDDNKFDLPLSVNITWPEGISNNAKKVEIEGKILTSKGEGNIKHITIQENNISVKDNDGNYRDVMRIIDNLHTLYEDCDITLTATANEGTSSEVSKSVKIRIDRTKPTINMGSGEVENTIWIDLDKDENAKGTIDSGDVSATDEMSGKKSLRYIFTDENRDENNLEELEGDPRWKDVTGKITQTISHDSENEQDYYIYYRAEDNAGNVEYKKSKRYAVRFANYRIETQGKADQYAMTLQDAINKCSDTGSKIVVIQNVDDDSTVVDGIGGINANKNFTLDTNGHTATMTDSIVVASGKTVTFVDNKTGENKGKLERVVADGVRGDLVVVNGTVNVGTNANDGAILQSKDIVINGANNGNVNLKSGEVKNLGKSTVNGYSGIWANNVNMSGGKISGNAYYGIVSLNGIVTGGEIQNVKYGICPQSGTLNVSGNAKIYGNVSGIATSNHINTQITVTGGEVIGGSNGILIYGKNNKITIGRQEDALNENNPIIRGNNGYGIDFTNESTFSLNFYSGQIIGTQTSKVKGVDVSYSIADETKATYRTGYGAHTTEESGVYTTTLVEPEFNVNMQNIYLNLKDKTTEEIKVTGRDLGTITYTSQDETKATVAAKDGDNKTGVVTAKAEGTTKVIVKDTNSGLEKEITVYVDNTPPQITKIEPNTTTLWEETEGKVQRQEVTVTIEATDNISGVKTIQYIVDQNAADPAANAEWQTYNDTDKIKINNSKAGEYYIHIKVTDKSGNVTIGKSEKYIVKDVNYTIEKDGNTQLAQTLAEAVNNAQTGSTIKPLKDYTDNSTATINKDVTIDTNGKTLTMANTITVAANKTVTFVDTAITKGKLERVVDDINNGNLINNSNNSIVNIGTNSTNGAVLEAKANTIRGGNVNVFSGEVNSIGNYSGKTYAAIYANNINVSGGQVQSNNSYAIIDTVSLNISDGKISSKLGIIPVGTVEIRGNANISGTSQAIYFHSAHNANIAISGGTITSDTIAINGEYIEGFSGIVNINITGGIITGGTNGITIRTKNSTLTIDDSTAGVNQTSPKIQGTNGYSVNIYGTGSTFNYNDGLLVGKKHDKTYDGREVTFSAADGVTVTPLSGYKPYTRKNGDYYGTVLEKEVTVTADAGDGTISATDGWTLAQDGKTATKKVLQNTPYGTLPTKNEMERTGYTFKGWNGKNLFKLKENVDWKYGDTTYNVNLSDNSIRINNGTYFKFVQYYLPVLKANTTYTISGKVELINRTSTFVRITKERAKDNGNTFLLNENLSNGYFSASFTIGDNDETTAALTLFGNLGGNDESGAIFSNIQIEEGSAATAYEPYYVTDDTKVTQEVDHTLTAVWEANDYTVHFDGDGATGGTMADQTFKYDEEKALTQNAYTRAHTVNYDGNQGTPAKANDTATYQFTNWINKTTSQIYQDKAVVKNLTSEPNGEVTLYAVWNPQSVTLPTATREGYIFNGWYDAATGGNKIGDAGDKYIPEANTTLHAQWRQVHYTISVGTENLVAETMQEAIKLAEDRITGSVTTATITATESYTDNSTANITKNITIDIPAGKTITIGKTIAVSGEVTFTGTGKLKRGIVVSGDKPWLINDTGKVTVDGPTLEADGTVITGNGSHATGSIIVNSGEVKCLGTNGYNTASALYVGTVEVNGGKVTSNSQSGYAIASNNCTITSGNISANSTAIIATNNGTITISGENTTISGSNAISNAADTHRNSTININGGTLTGRNAGISLYAEGQHLTITGGTIIGGNNGVNVTSANSTVTIGNSATAFNQITPSIQGGQYSVQVTGSGSTLNYYDGKLIGKSHDKTYDGREVTFDVAEANVTLKADYKPYTRKNGDYYETVLEKEITVTAEAGDGAISATNGWTIAQDGKTATKKVLQNVEYGTLPTQQQMTKTGYTFQNWTGKNLFDQESILMAINGATKENNHYVFTFLDSYNKYGKDGNMLPLNGFKANTSYTLTINGYVSQVVEQYGGLVFHFHFTDDTNQDVGINNLTENTINYTTPNNKTISYIAITYGSGGAFKAYISSIQLEEGTTATEYEPYTVITADTVVKTDADHKIYAVWEANNYLVTADANGGTIPATTGWTGSGASTTKTVKYDSQYGALPTPTRDGYTFDGWYKENTFQNKVETDTIYKTAGNSSIYAKWTANTYKIKFNANGGTGTMADLDMKYDTAKNLTSNAFTKTGYHFKEWTKNSDGTGTKYTDGQSVNNLTTENGATVNLYAQWEANTAEITIKKDNEEWSNSGINVALYQSGISKYAYSVGTASGAKVNFTIVAAGTYDVYASKTSAGKTTLVDTGVDITVGNTGTALVDYYTLTRSEGKGSTLTTKLDSASGTDIATGTQVLKNTTIYIKSVAKTGYNTPTLKVGETAKTPAEDTFAITAASIVKSGATANELVFENQTKTATFKETSQTVTITGASNGTGTYTYTEKSEKNASGTATNYISISGTTITLAESTPAGTYTYVVTVKDTYSEKTKDATITITVNKAKITIPSSPAAKIYNGAAQSSGITTPAHTSIVETPELVINGNGSYGNNTNFSAWTYDASNSYNGSNGSFSLGGGYSIPKTNEYFALSTDGATYKLDFDAKTANGNSTYYSMMTMYDIDKKEMQAPHYMFINGTTTTLAKDLKKGDKVIYLTNLSGWRKDLTETYQKGFIVWNYKNSQGFTYPAETYSRNVYTNLYNDGNSAVDVNEGTITLDPVRFPNGWTVETTIPAGTALSQSNSGNTFKYIGVVGSKIPTSWTHYTGSLTGTYYSGANATKFPPYAVYGKVGFLWNYNGVNNTGYITNVSVTGKSVTSATNVGTYSIAYQIDDPTNYEWEDGTTTLKTVPWIINPYDISNNNSTIGAIANQTYTGNAITPNPTVTALSRTLTKDTDYKLTYKDNVNAGTSTVYVLGKGNFTGSKSTTFTINKAANTIDVAAKTGLVYNTTAQSLVTTTNAQGTVYYSTTTELTASNYTDTSKASTTIPTKTDAGTYTVYWYTPGNDNYNAKNGSIEVTIAQFDISSGTMENVAAQNYTGSAIEPKPKVTVTINGESKQLTVTSEFTYSYTSNTNPTNVATVTAKGNGNYKGRLSKTFTINPKVTFDKNDTSATGTMNEQYVLYNANTELTQNGFSKTGYYFKDWNTEANGSGTSYANKANVKLTANTILYAHWTAKKYTVTLNAGDGTIDEGDDGWTRAGDNKTATKDITYDSNYGTLPTASKPGYEFDGWFTEATGGTKITNTTIMQTASAVTLYPHWTANNYKIKFNANGGTGEMADESMIYDQEKALTKNTFTRNGYTFQGWSQANEGFENKLLYSNDAEAYSGYSPEGFTLKEFIQYADFAPYFDKYGTNAKYRLEYDIKSDDTSKRNYIEVYFLNGSTTKYDFVKNSEQGNVINSQHRRTVTVSSTEWTHDAFDFKVYISNVNETKAMLAFYGAYDTGNKPRVKNVRLSIIPDYTDEQVVKNLTAEKNGEVTLYAQWEPNKYNVVFNKNADNATGTMANQEFTYDQAQNLTQNAFSRTGYSFAGWATTATGNVEHTDKKSVKNLTSTNNGTVNLFAKWTANPYKVTLNAGAGTMNEASGWTRSADKKTSTKEITYDGAYGTLPTASLPGYNFLGWFTEATGGTEVKADTIMKTAGTVSLYAHWEARTDTPYVVKHYQMDLNGNYPTEPTETQNLQGTTDTKVTPEVKTYTGFKSPSAQEITIKGDGTAVVEYRYERNKYNLDLNGWLDGVKSDVITGYGTADIYINGAQAKNDIDDYSEKIYYGSTYEIKDIKASDSHKYNSVHTGKLTGTMGTDNIEVLLDFTTQYTITYNLDGGNITGQKTTYDIYTETFTLPSPTKTNYTFLGWNEEIANMNWYKGFLNLNTGAIENNTTYPNSYYTNTIKLKAGVKYTLSGYGSYAVSNIRMRVYNIDGSYKETISSTNNYTPTTDCYIRILFFSNPTEAQRTGTKLTSTIMTSVEIPKGSQGNRTYTANWAKFTLSESTIYVKTNGTGVIAKEGTADATGAQITYTIEGASQLEFVSENTGIATVSTTDNIAGTVKGVSATDGGKTKIIIKDKTTGVKIGEIEVVIDITPPQWIIELVSIFRGE